MHIRVMRTVTMFLAVGLLVGCGRGDAESIREQLEEDNYRATYARAPGWEQPFQPSAGGPHGPFVDIYVNDIVDDAIQAGEPIDAWPEGSLIVKDGWEDDQGQELRFLAFMERRADGWFWGEYNGNDRLIISGENNQTCAGCHSSGQDSVRAFDLPGR